LWQGYLAAPEYRPWLIIAAGLCIGIMARWAVMQSINQPVSWRQVRIDGLVLMMNGLLAAQFAELFNLHGTKLGVAAAMFGASSTMVFAKLHETFVTKAVKTAIFIGPSETAAIPPAIPPPVEVHAVGQGHAADARPKRHSHLQGHPDRADRRADRGISAPARQPKEPDK
jgi:hypothetical protein